MTQKICMEGTTLMGGVSISQDLIFVKKQLAADII